MTNAYLSEQDSFGRWLVDMEPCGLAQGAGASALFESFKGWCTLNGANLSPATFTAFGKTAASRNIQKGRGASGVVYGLRPVPVDFF